MSKDVYKMVRDPEVIDAIMRRCASNYNEGYRDAVDTVLDVINEMFKNNYFSYDTLEELKQRIV
jgi:hypothetical protein